MTGEPTLSDELGLSKGVWLRNWVLLSLLPIWIAFIGSTLTQINFISGILGSGALIVYATAIVIEHEHLLRRSKLAESKDVRMTRAVHVVEFLTWMTVVFGAITSVFLMVGGWAALRNATEPQLHRLVISPDRSIAANALLAGVALVTSFTVMSMLGRTPAGEGG